LRRGGEGHPQGVPLRMVCEGGWLVHFVGDIVVGVYGEHVRFVEVGEAVGVEGADAAFFLEGQAVDGDGFAGA